MKVLFISSGRNRDISVIVKNQGESLKPAGIEIDYFLVNPGLFGYLLSIPKLRRAFKKNGYDIAHAHYSLSGFVASLAGCKPLIVSLMGSDVLMSDFMTTIIRFFSRHRWAATIVKTKQMMEAIGIVEAFIIPNGVNLEKFKPMSKSEARNFINYPPDKNLVLFIASQNRPEKNFELAKKATSLLDGENLDLKYVSSVSNNDIPYYLNASEVLLLTSNWEGSANVIKEAMACNCPVVATNVGDVNWLFGSTSGYYISGFLPEDVAHNLKSAYNFSKNVGRTKGRDRIIALGLDSGTVAMKIVNVYKKALGLCN